MLFELFSMDLGLQGGILIDFTMILDVISMIADGFWPPFEHGFSKKTTRNPTYHYPQFSRSFFGTHSERDFCRPPRSIVAERDFDAPFLFSLGHHIPSLPRPGGMRVSE